MWGWTVSATFTNIGWVEVMDGYWLSRPRSPWVCCLPPSAYPHRIILQLISGHSRQGTSHPEPWCRMTLGDKAVLFGRLYPARLGAVVLGVAGEEHPYSPQWVPDLNDNYDVSWWEKPAALRNMTGALRNIIVANRNCQFKLDYKKYQNHSKIALKKNCNWKHWIDKIYKFTKHTHKNKSQFSLQQSPFFWGGGAGL